VIFALLNNWQLFFHFLKLKLQSMHRCISCGSGLEVERVGCPACGIRYEGKHQIARLARLEPAHQQLAERVLLAGGNLKQVAGDLEISYPTLRKRMDELIAALQASVRADEELCRKLLDAVEDGRLPPEEAARRIKEMNGAL
jgi:hypothetical protein